MQTYFIDHNEMGLDESGRGPLLGRVYAAAVVIGDEKDEKNENIPFITDSKKMSAHQREKAEKWIIEHVKAYAVAYAEPSEIDEINILEATRNCMQQAADEIYEKHPHIRRLVIDGWRWEKKFDREKYDIHSVVKGDATYLSIAMASILAKEAHDRYITDLCDQYPELHEKYDLRNNMGYGTKKHLEGLKRYGPSDFHRKSFKPCINKK